MINFISYQYLHINATKQVYMLRSTSIHPPQNLQSDSGTKVHEIAPSPIILRFKSTKMYPRAIAAALLAVYPFSVDAGCKSFTNTRFAEDTPYDVDSQFGLAVTSLACPSSSQSACTIQPISTNLTVAPQINFQEGATGDLTDSASDFPSIVALASQAWAANKTQAQPFTTHSVVVSNSSEVGQEQDWLNVSPGMNKTWVYEPFYMYSIGTLGGCDNSTLNGWVVMVGAAYLNSTDGKGVMTGTWETYADNLTTPGGSATTTSATATPSITIHPNRAAVDRSSVWSGLLLTLVLFVLI
jgi:hypothetical protein